MGVFSEIAMEQQNSMFDSSAAFEDDEAFELEEMESLPVPPVGTDAVTVSAASVPAGETASADAEEEPVDEVASDGEEKSAEEGNSAQPPAAEDEEKKRAEHEAAEAQRKAEFDAKQQAKKAAEQEQIARLEAMSDEEVIAASTQRVSTDVEKLTRRNMKECVSEHTYYTLEVEPDGTVRQKRTEYDRQKKDIEQATEFLQKWQRVITARLTESDKALAAESRILREKEFIQLKKDRVIIHTGHLAGRLLADVLMADLMENTDSIQSPVLAAAA